MGANKIVIVGDAEFKALLREMGAKLQDKALRDIARKGGRVVVKAARRLNRIPGQLGKQFGKEFIVANDKHEKAGVIVTVRGGRRSKQYINSKGEKIIAAAVGRHMTEGAVQHDRQTKSGKRRGKVNNRYPDPILAAGQAEQNNVMKTMTESAIEVMTKVVKRYNR